MNRRKLFGWMAAACALPLASKAAALGGPSELEQLQGQAVITADQAQRLAELQDRLNEATAATALWTQKATLLEIEITHQEIADKMRECVDLAKKWPREG